MNVKNFVPTDVLKPFIKGYRIIECNEAQHNNVLPNTSVALAFRIKGRNGYGFQADNAILPAMVLSGLRKSGRTIHYAPQTATLVVLFEEGGASVFFRQPIHELFEQSIALADMITVGEMNRMEDTLAAAYNDAQRIAVVERFLLSRLKSPKPDALILEAVSRINAAKGMVRIKELTKDLFISNDAFEKRFRKSIGASPKQFASIVRMSAIVHHRSYERLLDLAFDAGYYDQAHFNKEFKLFTGQTPTEFYKNPLFW